MFLENYCFWEGCFSEFLRVWNHTNEKDFYEGRHSVGEIFDAHDKYTYR